MFASCAQVSARSVVDDVMNPCVLHPHSHFGSLQAFRCLLSFVTATWSRTAVAMPCPPDKRVCRGVECDGVCGCNASQLQVEVSLRLC